MKRDLFKRKKLILQAARGWRNPIFRDGLLNTARQLAQARWSVQALKFTGARALAKFR